MGGSPFSGPRLFNLFLILCFAIPYSLYKFYTAPEIMVSISPDGLLVPSAHKDRIPWNKVSGVELVPHSFFPTRAPFVRVRIEQSAKTGYPAPVLIHKPNLATSPKDVFDDIVAFWERYREKA